MIGFKLLHRSSDILQWRCGPVLYTRVGSSVMIDVGPFFVAVAGRFEVFQLRWRNKPFLDYWRSP